MYVGNCYFKYLLVSANTSQLKFNISVLDKLPFQTMHGMFEGSDFLEQFWLDVLSGDTNELYILSHPAECSLL